jgi:RimJ/RimL family protein N-acetyltransferase
LAWSGWCCQCDSFASTCCRTGQRGRGYAYDLLAEATHLLVAQGTDRIVASTHAANAPMAATFAKAGYPVAQQRIDLVC